MTTTLTDPLTNDPINHPKHYSGYPATVECIDVTRHLPFDLGNAVNYVWRAGKKGNIESAIEDLKKARWYLDDWDKLDAILEAPVAEAVWKLIPEPPVGDDPDEYRRWSIICAIIEDNQHIARDLIRYLVEKYENLLG